MFVLASSALGQTKVREGNQTTGALPTSQGGVLSGGTTGQALKKASNANYDLVWTSTPTATPSATATPTPTPTPTASAYSIFKTIDVSGQSSVVADSDADTLTLAAGNAILVTTNASTDTITIAVATPTATATFTPTPTATSTATPTPTPTPSATATATPTATAAAPIDAHYVTTQAESGLSAEANLGALTTGLIKGTVSGSVSTLSSITDSSTNWNTAYTERLEWDGGATNLVAATGRTSLGLVIGTNVQAWDTQLDSLSGLSYTGNTLKVIRVNAGETGFELATAGAGTVTNTGGTLTSNAVVLGAGSADTKVTGGIITDGTAKLTLGVNATTLGQLKLFGNTSGDATIQPSAVAGTSTVVTLPNASSTLPIFGQQITFSGPSAARTVTFPDAAFTAARTDAANTFTGHQTIEGVTSTGATGTGKFVFDGTPTLVTPNFTTGFTIGTAAASGKIPIGNGTNYVASTPTYPNTATNNKVLVGDGTNVVLSTPTFPNASATSGKIIKSDGTNWTASTETYAAPGTSGNVLTSDGTNWTSAAASGGGGTTSKVAGSNFTEASGAMTDITGLTFAVATNKVYEVDVLLKVQQSTTGGIQFALACSASGSTGQYVLTATAAVNGTGQTYEGNTLGTASGVNKCTTANFDYTVIIKAMVTTVGNTGNITVQMQRFVGGTATCYIGSRMTVTQM